MNTIFRFCLLAVASIAPAAPLIADSQPTASHPARLLAALRSSTAEEARAVDVRKLEIDMGPGTLVIESGVIVPAAPVDGRTLETAFVGDAWFRFSTPDPVESHQLELFTGETALVTPVSHAVIVTGNEGTFSTMLAGDRSTSPQVREAVKLYKDWVKGAERQGFAADLSMIRSLVGDPRFRNYFAVWCRSPEQGDFFYIVDPSESEPITLGQFVPVDLSGLDVWQQRWVKNYMRRYKFQGRFSEFSMEHPGDWDTWASPGVPPGATPAGSVQPEPEHYAIDLYVNPTIELDAKGSARIRLRAGAAAAQTIELSLYSGLRVEGVFGPESAPLGFIRREGALHVFLAKPLEPGGTMEIRVEFAGDLLEQSGKEAWALLDTESWYPRTGAVDRATYELTLRRPSRFAVLASGHHVDSGEENGVAWERRSLDVPALGATFELGRFDIVRDRAGHIELTFGFPAGDTGPSEEARRVVIDTTKRCLPWFEEKLGPYPLDYITIVTVNRGFSQGMLSMITLAEAAMEDLAAEGTPEERRRAEEAPALTISHEISHQWWGNWVGWASYRDQWLSEALAEYSSFQFGASTAENKTEFLARNARDWRGVLAATTADGRSVAALGPVTLGARLDSSKSSSGYQAIVYYKGAVVFRMLARMIGEEPFGRMLGELTRTVANRTLDTETFLKAIERMSGSDLSLFANQFVYGTGIPDVYFRYTTEPAPDGKGWTIRGEARQVGSGHESLRITKSAAGAWTVQRDSGSDTDVPLSSFVVPFQVVVNAPQTSKASKPGEIKSARGFGGRLVVKGHRTPFQIAVPEKPDRFELDQLGEVLALFHDEDWTPKRTLRLQALDLAASGDIEAAKKTLGQALQVPVYSDRAIAAMSAKRRSSLDQDEEARFEEARIHTLLARFQMDLGDLEAAEMELATAEALLKIPDKQAGWVDRILIRSRLSLVRGDIEGAYTRLKKGLHDRWLGAEGYALLAVAAEGTGHDRIADQALKRAESRGVDVHELREARAASRQKGS